MTVRQFILQTKINEGATTTVYKAHQSVLDRTVLLKILHKHLIGDTKLTERFTREARACALIRSEYIVQVYDLTEIDGAPAIVMEYVDGTSLKDVLAAEGPLPAGTARQFIIETLNALRAAHVRGVIHRDIKPGNLLVTDTGHIKVTDFGLAAISVSQTVTMDGAVLGTPAYLPPEHIRGEAADERSDLFSLGATWLEILTGQRIFEGASYSACINKILQFDAASIDALVPDRGTAEAIKKMMHPDREQRFPSAEAALEALHGEREKIPAPELPSARSPQEPTPVQAPQGPASARQQAPPPRLARLGTTLLLLAVSALIAALVWYLLRPESDVPVHGNAPILSASGDSAQQRRADIPASSPALPAQAKAGNGEQASGAVPSTTDSGVKAAEKDSSGLLITCTPWGKVFLDNQYLGETPLSGSVMVRAGTHTLNVTNPEFLPIVKTVTAPRGAQLSVAVNFFETAGYLIVTVAPWAEVYIDDLYRDTTPREKPFIVTAGKRKIRLHNPGFADVVSEVSVPKNDTLRLSYTLTRMR